MSIPLILAHPNPGSFNHALAAAARETLAACGHDCRFHDLYQEKFNPVMEAPEIPSGAALPPEVEPYAAELEQAIGLIIVHPNWWCQPPAILKGWVDRVLRPGRAYRFVPDGQGGGRAVGLLKLQTALVISTANNPQEREVALYGDPLEVFWKKVVLGICGIPRVRRLIFAPVITSTAEQRAAWLDETRRVVREVFARVP